MPRKIPQEGDTFFPQYESDWVGYNQTLLVERVVKTYTNGFDIIASDGLQYLVHWSSDYELWCRGIDA